MCEFLDKFMNYVRSKIGNRTVEEVYPRQNSILPYRMVRAGACPISGRPLDPQYMRPHGRCSRSLDEAVYQGVINNKRSTCALCGAPLPRNKQKAQRSEHREINHHFCSECEEYFAAIHAKVHGMELNPQPVAIPAPQVLEQAYDRHQGMGDDVMDADYQEVMRPALPSPVPQIGYHHQPTISDLMRQENGAEVVMLPRRR